MIEKHYDKFTQPGQLGNELVAAGLSRFPTEGYRFYSIFIYQKPASAWDTMILVADDITHQELTIIDNVLAVHIPLPTTDTDPFIRDSSGKIFVRSESRPLDCTTYFTTAGDKIDAPQGIGEGARLEWDATVSAGWVEDTQAGVKRLTVESQFIDSVWIKEGTVYWMDAAKGNYLDMYVVCPNGGYYMYLSQVYQNTTGSDLVVEHYVNKHPIQGDCPMGDEMNTETCSQEMPSYLKVRMVMTTPITDTTSHGYVELEMFRKRTVIIP